MPFDIMPYLTNLSSKGVSSRLRGSTLSGNWAMECQSRLRKLGKSVLSFGSRSDFSCSRNSTPTSPLSMTSQPASLDTIVSSSSLPSSLPSSCNSFSMTSREGGVSYLQHVFTGVISFSRSHGVMHQNPVTHQVDITSKPRHHFQMFMVHPPEFFVVHSSGMAPVMRKENHLSEHGVYL